jgi:hypothetical protein
MQFNETRCFRQACSDKNAAYCVLYKLNYNGKIWIVNGEGRNKEEAIKKLHLNVERTKQSVDN